MKALIMELNRRGPSVTPRAGWFARYVGETFLTDQRSLLDPTGWEKFSGTWPSSGSMRGGFLYALPTSARLIDGSGSSYLLTPASRDWKGDNGRASTLPNTLAAQVEEELLPTPRTSDANGKGDHGDGGPDLRTSLGDLTTPPSDDGSEP